jgi:hypothetical protein
VKRKKKLTIFQYSNHFNPYNLNSQQQKIINFINVMKKNKKIQKKYFIERIIHSNKSDNKIINFKQNSHTILHFNLFKYDNQ